jgi:hypothetical protein
VILLSCRSETSRLDFSSLPTAEAVGFYLTPLRGLTPGERPFGCGQDNAGPGHMATVPAVISRIVPFRIKSSVGPGLDLPKWAQRGYKRFPLRMVNQKIQRRLSLE